MQKAEDYIKSGKKLHLIGIGGISMSSLAEFLLKLGISVTGSDSSRNECVLNLEKQGIKIYNGHFAENVHGADCIIRTAAIHDDNPEIVEARRLGIPVFERAEAFGVLMKTCKHAVCFAGTHGKTTTTSMFTCIALKTDLQPSAMIGGVLPAIGSTYKVGTDNMFILEACEYHNSFLSFFPTVSVITNVDEDHLDFFKNLDDIKNSFKKFALLVPQDTGVVVVNGEDANALDAVKDVDRKKITFGFSNKFDVYIENLTYKNHLPEFDIKTKTGETVKDIKLKVTGTHNCLNALAAASAGFATGISAEIIKEGLESFTGVARRFEFKGIFNGASVFDDYAHHPNEIKALFDSVEKLGYKRTIVVFQSHTYTRTKAFWNDFIRELSRPDKIILADIYAARETDNLGISSELLAQNIPNSEYIGNYDDIVSRLKELAQNDDLIITLGAGEMNQISDKLTETH